MSVITRDMNTKPAKGLKAISPTTHGVIDYGHAAFFFVAGLMCRRANKAAATAAFATSAFILVQSLLTDYRLGWKPVISFKTHGKMDSIFAASSWAVPVVFGFKETKAAKIFEMNSVAEASVVRMTDWDSVRAHRERVAS
jgi:hypothetical protein